MPTTLSARQGAFVSAYVANGFNGVQAARSAGYDQTDAALAVTASRLLTIDKVQAAVADHQAKASAAAEVSLPWLLAELRGLAASQDCKPADRIAALRELGKLLGYYVERSVTVAAFVRPELAGKSLADLEAIERLLFPPAPEVAPEVVPVPAPEVVPRLGVGLG